MKIAYLVEDAGLGDDNSAPLSQADALIARGHQVRIVTKDSPVSWRSSHAEWIHVDDLRQYDASDDDFVIGTFWLTLQPAYAIAGDRAVHLCHGYEGLRDEIEAAYRLPIPKLVVSKSLIPVFQHFTNDVTYIGQIVDEDFYRIRTWPENEPMRVLLTGPSQIEMKGIEDGYGAAAHARWFHQKFDLIRVSPWAPSREEPLDDVQEFHVGLDPREMTRLMHTCDVFLGPNHGEEGFGLPAAEAMASGIPTVLTSIPSYLSFDEVQDYALFAPQENAVELGERLIEVLGDFELRERVRARGRAVAEQWRAEKVAGRLEVFFLQRLGSR